METFLASPCDDAEVATAHKRGRKEEEEEEEESDEEEEEEQGALVGPYIFFTVYSTVYNSRKCTIYTLSPS